MMALPRNGEVAEWLKAAASKAVVPLRGTAGSNPALSAIEFCELLSPVNRLPFAPIGPDSGVIPWYSRTLLPGPAAENRGYTS